MPSLSSARARLRLYASFSADVRLSADVRPEPADAFSARPKAVCETWCGPSVPPKRGPDWSVNEVIEYVHNLGLSRASSSFQSNAVDGEMLCALSEADLQSELGLTVLQARKIRARLPE